MDNIERIKKSSTITQRSPLWFDERKNTLSASRIGSVTGKNTYENIIQYIEQESKPKEFF